MDAAGAPGPGALALRRSALRTAPDGPLSGSVVSVRATPEVVRLTVDVPGVGEVHAVAGAGEVPGVGSDVRLVVDLTRTARLGAPRDAGGTP
jgi:thiamine transport system ATP-binding protein